MKKDVIYILVIFCLSIICLYFAKTREIGSDNYSAYKELAEKRIAGYQANEILLNYKFDSIKEKNDNLAKIDKSKEVNLKIVYVQGKKEYDRAVTLPLDSAILYMQAGLNRERQYQDSNH